MFPLLGDVDTEETDGLDGGLVVGNRLFNVVLWIGSLLRARRAALFSGCVNGL